MLDLITSTHVTVILRRQWAQEYKVTRWAALLPGHDKTSGLSIFHLRAQAERLMHFSHITVMDVKVRAIKVQTHVGLHTLPKCEHMRIYVHYPRAKTCAFAYII